ncbi:FecR family protein [Mariniphaga anaerophila]|uniref:FecR family protein n=1 Tax=Mariniphaga anaerophila TaxID=1484053 RepID=A0A1M4XKH7_9BACT|nr:FecR domain-containing protein [Mariniphaga anaerophila]SHE93868.1 FecR family protein [Mariniphaga anaerophila]
MDKKKKIKAYDILSEDNFRMESLSDTTEKADKEEIQFARIIYSYLSIRKSASQKDDKEQIRSRIQTSLGKIQHRKRNLVAKWAVAASFFLAVFSAWFLYHESSKGRIETAEFAQALELLEPDSVTSLVLHGGKKVLIPETESHIAYDKKGERIVIDTTREISQQVAPKEEAYNTLVVPYGKRTRLTLSDGTQVWLNSGTKMVYPANLTQKRKVYIEGEAVFEVTHSENHPFYVATKDFEIKVLGTVFNVSAYADDKASSAILERGKIELTADKESFLKKGKLTISPGTMAVFDTAKRVFSQQQVDAADYMSWRDGYFILKNEPLANIVKRLERYYNVEIVIESAELMGESFSGNLNFRNTPEEVLRIISVTTPFKIRHEEEKLIINLN